MQLWINDAISRLTFWRSLIDSGISTPILGQGAAAYTIGRISAFGVTYGSAHNVFVSQFIVGGIVGVSLFLAILLVSLVYLGRWPINEQSAERQAGIKCIWFGLFTLILVMCTNDLTAGRGVIFFALIALISTPENCPSSPIFGRIRAWEYRLAGLLMASITSSRSSSKRSVESPPDHKRCSSSMRSKPRHRPSQRCGICTRSAPIYR